MSLKTAFLILWHGMLFVASWVALGAASRLWGGIWGRWCMTDADTWRWAFLLAMGIGLIEAWVIAAMVGMR